MGEVALLTEGDCGIEPLRLLSEGEWGYERRGLWGWASGLGDGVK
jgi:hypothetical protein